MEKSSLRTILRYLVIFLAGVSCATTQKNRDQKCQHQKFSFSCVEYIKNYDGDTVTFDIPYLHPLIGENISVRIRGIDTPEIKAKNPCEKRKAVEAREFVSKLLTTSNRVDLRNLKRRYSRKLWIDTASRFEFDLMWQSGHPVGYKQNTAKWPPTRRPLCLSSS